jgi:hypothetical protein
LLIVDAYEVEDIEEHERHQFDYYQFNTEFVLKFGLVDKYCEAWCDLHDVGGHQIFVVYFIPLLTVK